ncbi:spermine oxidase isoform X2 [Phymastichus coffea]|uniref:spermine oxidase isoform X2 n=1 Tax=Phymastichus coffea TaxID=108790 RepID=UPI00273C1EDA|nr:spermine oxidase isoform X2 [Phymastichus coffea]
MVTKPKVIIIGAGAAGIAAASRLIEKGLNNVLILEAKNRIGGRIHTVKFSENILELGAQWCHGEENNIIYSLASPHNLLESSSNINNPSKHIFVNSLGEVLSEQESVEIIRIYNKIADMAKEIDYKPGTSYGDYFTQEFYKEIYNNPLITKGKEEEILNFLHNYENSIECSDTWYNISAIRLKDYWQCKGDSLLNWKTNGYSKIFDLLTRNYPDGNKPLPVYEKILFNKEVSLIDYSKENNIKVVTTDNSVFEVSNVIFTPSLGVLKEQYSTLFKPALSKLKIDAIKGLSIGVTNKFFLEFSHQWWPKNAGALCLMWTEKQKLNFLKKYGNDKSWLCDLFLFFTVDYQPRILSGWIVGPSSRYAETLSDEKVLNEFYLILQIFLGHIYDIPKPISIVRSKWYSDKHVRVHGAIETGFREADRIIEYYRCLKSHL